MPDAEDEIPEAMFVLTHCGQRYDLRLDGAKEAYIAHQNSVHGVVICPKCGHDHEADLAAMRRNWGLPEEGTAP